MKIATDNWRDYFNNAPLLVAFVMKMDDPVRQFAVMPAIVGTNFAGVEAGGCNQVV